MTTAPEPAALACLERTRSAVLNILVAVGCEIAASGFPRTHELEGFDDPMLDPSEPRG